MTDPWVSPAFLTVRTSPLPAIPTPRAIPVPGLFPGQSAAYCLQVQSTFLGHFDGRSHALAQE